jgi:Mg/Co/Ni transporter MgtE
MHTGFARLSAEQTVEQGLEFLRTNQPEGRIVYFYVVDSENRLRGVVPTRRLLLSPLESLISEIMIPDVSRCRAAPRCSRHASSSSCTDSWHFPSSTRNGG